MAILMREALVENVALHPKSRAIYKKIFIVYKTMYPHIIKSIDNYECPFCHRRFTTFSGIVVHLKSKSPCNYFFNDTVRNAVKVYGYIKENYRINKMSHRRFYELVKQVLREKEWMLKH